CLKTIPNWIRLASASPICIVTLPSCPILPVTPKLRTKASWKPSRWRGTKNFKTARKPDAPNDFGNPSFQSQPAFHKNVAAHRKQASADPDSKLAPCDCGNPELPAASAPETESPS